MIQVGFSGLQTATYSSADTIFRKLLFTKENTKNLPLILSQLFCLSKDIFTARWIRRPYPGQDKGQAFSTITLVFQRSWRGDQAVTRTSQLFLKLCPYLIHIPHEKFAVSSASFFMFFLTVCVAVQAQAVLTLKSQKEQENPSFPPPRASIERMQDDINPNETLNFMVKKR